jgi:hypothetical protein
VAVLAAHFQIDLPDQRKILGGWLEANLDSNPRATSQDGSRSAFDRGSQCQAAASQYEARQLPQKGYLFPQNGVVWQLQICDSTRTRNTIALLLSALAAWIRSTWMTGTETGFSPNSIVKIERYLC